MGNVKEKTEPWPSWLVTLTRPLVRGDDGFGDRQTHAGAANEIALIFAAIKLVENHGLFEVVDAGTAVGDAGGDGIAVEFSGDGDGLIFCANRDWRYR